MSPSPPTPARARSWLGQALLRTQSDERLAALCGDGSAAAFAVLVDRYRGELTGQARKLAGAQAAEDVVQQALTSAWAALCSGTEVTHPRAWLHQIARHAATQARSTRPGLGGESGLDQVASESAEDRYLHGSRAREALAAMSALPERQRRALELTALHGASSRTAARELGLKENALRQAVHRARRTVRAAATAVTPYPLLHWAAPGSGAETISTVAAGAGAGTSALMLKGTAVMVAAGVSVGGTAALLGRPGDRARGARPAEASALSKPRSEARASGRGQSPGSAPALAPAITGGSRGPGQRVGGAAAPAAQRSGTANHQHGRQGSGAEEGSRTAGHQHDGSHHDGGQRADAGQTHTSEHASPAEHPSNPDSSGGRDTPSGRPAEPSHSASPSGSDRSEAPSVPVPESAAGAGPN